MSQGIDIDLSHDLADCCRRWLDDMGYGVTAIVDDVEAIRTFLGVRRRLVPLEPRQVFKSKDFACPPEHAGSLAKIEHVIQAGGDLTPYLSRKIKSPEYNDGLLNHWGIHHLHLGTELESDGFMQRTERLLFFRFDGGHAYLIDILPHKESWTLQRLIGTLHDNWPDSIRNLRLHGVTADHLQDTQVKNLRKANVNHVVGVADGTVYAPLGGGTTGSGRNVLDVIQADQWIDWACQRQKEIIKDFDDIGARAQSRGITFPDTAKFKLTIKGETFCAVEIHSGYTLPLRGS